MPSGSLIPRKPCDIGAGLGHDVRVTAPSLTRLVDTWIDGFATSRSVPVRRRGGVVEVEVGGAERRLELVLVEPGQDLLHETWGRLVGTGDVWSTIFTRDSPRVALPAGLRVVLSDELLMTVDLTTAGLAAAAPPAPWELDVTATGQRVAVRLLDGDRVAASGQLGLVGQDAIFDRIGTESEYRRRGLATVVMNALAAWGVSQGARRGILAASVEGQALYRRLGWVPVAGMLTVAGSGE